VITLGRRDEVRHRLVVCGDNQLAYRLALTLAEQAGNRVTAVIRSRTEHHGPRIAAIEGVRVVESPSLGADALHAAGVAQADALALVDQADVENIHTALQAHEINPNLRLVIRFFNMKLGYRIRELFPGSVVLSDSATAAPLFVDAALGQVPTSYAELPGRNPQRVYVARRSAIPADQVLLGLANTSAPFGQRRLPVNDGAADLVLARVTGPIPADADIPGDDVLQPDRRIARARNGLRGLSARRAAHPLALGWARTRAVLSPKLALVSLGLLGVLVLGTVALAALGESWGNAAYEVVLDAAGAAQPDVTLSVVKKILQAVITITGITFIPVVTAAFVDAVVKARLATALGRPPRMRDHVVVVGLGNVGARGLMRLHYLGIPVIGVEVAEDARGVLTARRLGIPVVLGDATRDSTLRDAQVSTSRSLLGVTNNDVVNLEAGLHGQAMKAGLRVVLRLFDDDLAERVERSFGITTSRSVSFLAAPAFAAAMVGRQILATIPVGRQVLLIAELPVGSQSAMVGLPARAADVPHTSRVIAVQRHGVDTLELPAPAEHLLEVGDRLVVVATRGGLNRLISWSSPARPGKPGGAIVS
jgi:Trk K+ transport system NAD-binding subunit